jgi:hypothetical protein
MRRPRRLTTITAVGCALAMLLCSAPALADGDLANELRDLHADRIVLMTIPPFMSFRSRVTESRFEAMACTYEVSPGPSFDDVIETLGSRVIQTGKPKQELDLRVGVSFKRGGDTLRKLYFQGGNSFYYVRGFSGDRELSAKPDLPERLRSITRYVTKVQDQPWCHHEEMGFNFFMIP